MTWRETQDEVYRLDSLGVRVPTLVVDRQRALANIERMSEKARLAGLRLRPHFKTHRSRAVGRWFRDFGVSAIAVSSVGMARYFAEDGWSDITVAFPVNVRELDEIGKLAEDLRLGVLVDSIEAAGALARAVRSPARVWLKVDTGYGRAGVAWDDAEGLASIARRVCYHGLLRFAGILSHNGLTYLARTRDGVERAHAEAMDRLRAARETLEAEGLGEIALSIGDTPSASVVDNFVGVDELRPGNFVFNDLTQVAIGSCSLEDVAVAVACPVVGVHRDRGTLVLYGGAVHLSAESLEDASGSRTWGLACAEWPEGLGRSAPVVSLSQEHAVVAAPTWLSEASLGDLVPVLPVHSCLACASHREYVTLRGEVLDTMSCAARSNVRVREDRHV